MPPTEDPRIAREDNCADDRKGDPSGPREPDDQQGGRYDDDHSVIEALHPEERAALVGHWLRRTRSERQIGRGFSLIAAELELHGSPPDLVRRCTAAASEEAHHAEVCLSFARRCAGEPQLPALVDAEVELPRFPTDDPRLAIALVVLGTCCINETLATAYLELCVRTATVPFARVAHRHHLHEEIGHGRLGWALLASPFVDDELRAGLRPHLNAMLEANVPLWTREDTHLGAQGLPALGHPPRAAIDRVIAATVDEVIVPGFARLGL